MEVRWTRKVMMRMSRKMKYVRRKNSDNDYNQVLTTKLNFFARVFVM
jgi:hypothetical protein